jgi:hypothetical protein
MQIDGPDEDPPTGRRVTDDENEDGEVHYDREDGTMQTKKGKHGQDGE